MRKVMRRVPRIDVICPTCGKIFQLRQNEIDAGRRCCSSVCAGVAQKPRIERTCIHCGKSFTIAQYDADRGKGQFCSKRCRASFQNRTGFIDKICPQCHRAFTIKPGRHFQKYCSPECATTAITTRVKKCCDICGKTYEVKVSIADKSHYCSYECNGVAQQLAQSTRKKPTKIETTIDAELTARNISHKSQFVVGKCILDFALPEYRLGIECDGDYWHNRPNERQRDKARDKRLKKLGWTILRFTETEIKNSPSACVDKITDWLNEFTFAHRQFYLI